MWKDAYLESRVMAADPMELVSMLYEYGISSLQDARRELAAGNIALRAKAICNAISVVSELHASLDLTAGGKISENLASLYEYMKYRLTIGNLQKKDEPLAEVEGLLRTLAEAWSTIGAERQSQNMGSTGHYESHVPNMPFVMQPEMQASAQGWSA